MLEIQNFKLFPKIFAPKKNNNGATPVNKVSYLGEFSGANLAPLQKDTVTFTGGRGNRYHSRIPGNTPPDKIDETLGIEGGGVGASSTVSRASKKLDPADRVSSRVAGEILDEVDFAYKRFKNDIGNIFNMSVLDVTSRDFDRQYYEMVNSNVEKKSPILAITSRKKSPGSLAEKMGTKKIATKKGAKQDITDMLGVRILLDGSTPHPADYVMEKLTEAVNKGWIKIIEIENFKNSDIKPAAKFAYANQSRIDALAATIRKKGVKNFKYQTQDTESGYTAIHILCELPEGIKGELQIIGPDVLRLKEVEDLCYKVLTDKNIPSRYKEIKDMFEEIKNDKKKYAAFLDYTRRAYATERKRAPHKEDEVIEFLHLPKDSILDPKFDFNNLFKIKNAADYEHAQRLRVAEENATAASTATDNVEIVKHL